MPMPSLGHTLSSTGVRRCAGAVVVPAPTNLVAGAGDGQVELTWNEVSAATYNIYRGLAADSLALLAEDQVVALIGGVGDYFDMTAENGTEYFYAVKAKIHGALSANSNVASATPEPSP